MLKLAQLLNAYSLILFDLIFLIVISSNCKLSANLAGISSIFSIYNVLRFKPDPADANNSCNV